MDGSTARHGRIVQRWLAGVLVCALALQSACTTTPSPTLDDAASGALGRVAILAAATEPELAFEGFPHGKGQGAAAIGGGAFLTCVDSIFHGSCSGEICGAAYILMLGVCSVAGVAGAVVGAVTAPAANSVVASERSLTDTVTAATIQTSLRDHLRAQALDAEVDLVPVDPEQEQAAVASGDFRALAEAADTVLVVGFSEVGTSRTVGDALTLQAAARVRVVRARDNAVLHQADYLYSGGAATLDAWSANDGQRLLEGLGAAYRQLGGHIVDSVFLLYPFPDRGAQGAGFMAAAFGLAPIEPRNRGQLTGEPLIGDTFEWTRVTSRTPTLRWQSFPRETDLALASGPMGRVRNVRYDLVIARERDLAPAEIVYERRGLAAPVHRVESPLAADAHFFWTVRARFELDGRERVTEWSATHWQAAQNTITVPSRWCYRFRTP